MVGKLLIDGVDALATYGVFVLDDGLKGIVRMHTFKAISCTEWDEYDGAEYDLTEPHLDSKTFTLELGIKDIQLAENLFEKLSLGAYHEFAFKELGKTYKLRMVQNDSFYAFKKIGKLSLSLADDFPVINKSAVLPKKTNVRQTGYLLEGVDMSKYGIWIAPKSDDYLRKKPQVRKALTISSPMKDGVVYDDKKVFFKPKDVVLKCLINARTIEEFWERWEYLFKVLTTKDEKTFFFDKMNRSFSCFYKDNAVDVFKILPNKHVWCEFSLTLCFTGLGLRVK